MTKHTKPRVMKAGSFPLKLALLAAGESLLIDVKDRHEFNRKRDHVELTRKVPGREAWQFEFTVYHCSDLVKPSTNCLIMRIKRLPDLEEQ